MTLEDEVRVIPYRQDNAAMSLAIDRALLKMMNEQSREMHPIVRTYRFSNHAVVMGWEQKIEGRFDAELAKKLHVDLTKRDTGGGHMYFSSGDVHFSFVVPNYIYSGLNMVEIYQAGNIFVAKALQNLGYPAVLGRTSIRLNEIGGGKLLAGTARRLSKNAYLHHGAIMVHPYTKTIFDLLMAREDEVDKWNSQVTCLKESGINMYDKLPETIISMFHKKFVQDLTSEELELAEFMYDQFYANKDHIYSGNKPGDICLIAGERSTKGIDQDGRL